MAQQTFGEEYKVVTEAERSIKGADGLRAIACLMVMFHHFGQRLNLPAQDPLVQSFQLFFLQGEAGVAIFFVLSGFLLAIPFWKRYFASQALPSLKTYALRRAARIGPGYYLNIILCFFVAQALVQPQIEPAARFAAGLTFTAGFNWLTFFPVEINGPLWSIGFEVISYVLMPMAMWLMFKLYRSGKTDANVAAATAPNPHSAMPSGMRKGALARALFFWALVFALILGINQVIQDFAQTDRVLKGWEYGMVGGAKFWWPGYNPIGFFAGFAIGTVAAGISVWTGIRRENEQQAGRPARGSLRFDIIAGAALVLLPLFLWVMGDEGEFAATFQHQPYHFPIVSLLSATLLASASHGRVIWRILDNPVFRYTAKVSFGLYIWHYFLIEVLRLTILPHYQYFGIEDIGTWALICLAVLAVSYLVASLSWYLLEKRVLERAHAWKPKDAATRRQPRIAIYALAGLAIVVLTAVPVWASMLSPRLH